MAVVRNVIGSFLMLASTATLLGTAGLTLMAVLYEDASRIETIYKAIPPVYAFFMMGMGTGGALAGFGKIIGGSK